MDSSIGTNMLLPFTLQVVLFFLGAPVSAGPRCYYDVGKFAPEDIIPCYPSAVTEHYSCCKVGNKCLRNNACYDQDTGVTYQYGCTDETYQDSHCARKCNLDREKSHWAGLVFCNESSDRKNGSWICHHPDNCGGRDQDDCAPSPWDPSIEKLPRTHCKDLATDEGHVAFYGSATISDILPLPVSTELSSYFAEHSTRTIKTPVTSSASSTSRATTLQPSSSSSPAEPAETEQPQPPPAKPKGRLGIAVGLGTGVPIAIALAGCLAYRLHRWKREKSGQGRGEKTLDLGSSDESEPGYARKAELPGTDRPVHEVPGSPVPPEVEGSTVGDRTPLQSPLVSPLSTQTEFPGGTAGSRVSEIYSQPVHELPG
ncbi:hypothetical protein BS50DRAFT_135059 [Corynespora cassiicola Philippines]|uniref:Mid2 domain-containing protein n=1 Tax=Corynespora cassiicola Philippines TaxID=1448308 RepID=A0A2T2N9C7_CORCC|nr:hypothetical protein BS50DRAFT_135059 [Corynespora cassiicola Philippines]